jgi:uncharacterized membrane protein
MSDQVASSQPRIGATLVRLAILAVAIVGIIAVSLGPDGFVEVGRKFSEGRLHAPDLDLLARAPLVLQLHLATVLVGLGVGAAQLLGAKGTAMHRLLGWTFVVFMMFTALDAMFIKDGPTWRVTPIQLFSVFVLFGIPYAVLAARRHKIKAHAQFMTGVYFGGLVLAGALAFQPGRLMWRMFFG